MTFARTEREQKRAWQIDRTIGNLNAIVQCALFFRLGQPGQFLGSGGQELSFFVVNQARIHRGVGVSQQHLESRTHYLSCLPDHGSEQIALTASWCPENGNEDDWN